MPIETACLCHASTSHGALPAGEVRLMLRGLNAASAGSAETPPDRIKIANWGNEKFRGGEVLVNADAVAEIRRRMAANRQDRVRIDIVHKTAFRKQDEIEPENILGYGDLDAVEGEGLYLCNISWTDRGRAIWRALPDPSPAFLCRKGDHLMTQLDSVGLCPDGELELPTLCSAPASVGDGIYLQSAITENTMIELLIQLLKKAGVAVPDKGTQSDAEYQTALTAAAADYLGKGTETEVEMEAKKQCAAKPDATAAKIAELETKLNAVLTNADATERGEIVRRCSAEGKVIPLNEDQIYGRNGETAVALSTLRAICANLKPSIKTGTTGAQQRSGDNPGAKGDEPVVDEEQMACMARMGVTPDDIKKFAAEV